MDVEAQGLVPGRIPSFPGQTYHPLPVISEPTATPPLGQHGKFQPEWKHSPPTKQSKLNWEGWVPLTFPLACSCLFSPRAPVSLTLFYPSTSREGFQLKILCNPHAASCLLKYRFSTLLLPLTMMHKAPQESIFLSTTVFPSWLILLLHPSNERLIWPILGTVWHL